MLRYERALVIAITAHANQTRWSGAPYVCHPVSVAARVAAKMIGKFTPEFIELHKIAAVLHDTVEDTDVTLEQIRLEFGDEVADAVDHLTNREGEDGAPDETYEDFIERCSKNQVAVRVKLADLEDNSVGLKPESARAKKYAAAHAKLSALLVPHEKPTEPVS